MKRAEQRKNRREMLRTSARLAALASIGVVSGVAVSGVAVSGGLILRGSGPAADCRLGSCDDCRAMARCTLPPAVAAKNNKR